MRPLGSLSVSPLSLGGNVFGWTADEADSFAVLDAYVAGGGNFIDTADAYSAWVPGNKGGESETVLGNWLASRGNRSDVVIATKVGAHPDLKGLSAATIKSAVDGSLTRLRTDYIDLYYTHYDDESLEVGEFLTALDDLVRASTRSARSPRPTSRRSAWRSPWPSPPARAWPATSPSSPTTTWSPATPTRVNSPTWPPATASPRSRTSPSPPAS